MIEILQKQCDETKTRTEVLYKLLDSVVHSTDVHFEGCAIRGERTGLSYGVILNNRLIGSIVMSLNDMTITCNKIDDNGNIRASCVRSIDDNVPFREEYANTTSVENKITARDWFFEVSTAPTEYNEPAPDAEATTTTTDAGTEVEQVSAE